MSIPAEKSQQIATAFSKYIEKQDVSLINGFKLEDIKFTLLQYHADRNFPFYKAMEMKIKELEEKESKIAEEERMSITEEDIQKHTPKQILDILSKLSMGAWIWISISAFGIGGGIFHWLFKWF